MSDIRPEDREWLMKRADQTRQRWRDHEQITQHSRPIRKELEALRVIDKQLPFAVLTILIEHELQQDIPADTEGQS